MVTEKSSEALPPCRREFITIKNSRKIKNAIEVVGRADGLPDGWLKKIWTKNIAGKLRKDPYYKDPASGFDFRSKKDALRYLETGDFSKCKNKPKKIDEADLQSTETVLVKSTDVDGLPPGWIKEVKPRKVGKRSYTFYVDPVNGYMFWSKLDALRYIDSGDIRKCANKPKKRGADGNVSTQIVCQESSPMQPIISDSLNDGKQNFDTSNLKVQAESSNRMQENNLSVTGLTNNVTEVTLKTSLRSNERKTSETPPISEPSPEGSAEKDLSTASTIGTVVLDIQGFLMGIIEQKTESSSASRRASIAGCQLEMSPNLQLSSACEDFTMNPVPQPNLHVADVNASHEQKLPNDNAEEKNGNDTPAGLKTYKRKEASNSSRASKRHASQTMPNFNSSDMSSKRLAGSQLEPSPVTTPSSVPVVLPQPLKSEPLPGTETKGEHPEPAPGLADIFSMDVESMSEMDEIEMNEQPLVKDQAAVSEMKTGPENKVASAEMKTFSAETRIKLNEKPSFENLKPQNSEGPRLSAVDFRSDPSLDFAFKTLTGALAVEDTLSYNGCSEPQANTYTVHGNGHFGSANSHQSMPSLFQSTLAYHRSSQAQSNPSALGRNGSFEQSGTSNFTSFQQHTPTRFTSSWQHVQAEQPRHPSTPPSFDSLPPFRGIRIIPDTRSKDYITYRGFIN